MIRRVVLSIGWLAVTAMAGPEVEHAAHAEAARSILDAWRVNHVVDTPRLMHVVVWSPSDRDPPEGCQKRIDEELHGARDFFAGEMNRLGFGPMTMRFDYENDGMIRVHVAKGRRPAAEYQPGHAGEVREDCFRLLRRHGIKPVNENVIVFCDFAGRPQGGGADPAFPVFRSAATYQGGLAWFMAPTADETSIGPDHGEAEHSVMRSIHALCHQIGLSVGLSAETSGNSHSRESGVSMMSPDFDHNLPLFLTWADGLMLASHPLFSQCVKEPGGADVLNVSDWSLQPAAGGFSIKGKVEGSPPVYGIIAQLRVVGKEPVAVATAIPAGDGSFELPCEGLAGTGDAELRIVFLQANGAASGFPELVPHMFRYRMGSDGLVDSTLMEAAMVLVPFAEALWRNDTQETARLMDGPHIKGHAVFQEIADRWVRRKEGREVAMDPIQPLLALGDLKPELASTGYGPAVADRLPGPQPLLISGGRLFAHGLYAHAPSMHSWSLQGEWRTLKGAAGLADGHPGSVVFRVEGDGRLLWVSKTVKPGELVDFEVDVSGISKLVLKTTDAGDGKSHDWSLWLQPVLEK